MGKLTVNSQPQMTVFDPNSTYEELIEILIVLAEIVYALSDDDNFSGGWQAAEVVEKLKSLRVDHQADED